MPAPTGRFAPSPTGAPHFGTLVAAVASFLHARASGARWLIRIEDLDLGRVVPGAADQMLHTLEAFGLEWDGTPLYQSQRGAAHAEALARLVAQDDAYPCACTRRDLQGGEMGVDGLIYPGTCRNGLAPGQIAHSYRLRTHAGDICFDDLAQGCQIQNVEREVGDFIIRRGDGHFAYQLAVVVDDAFQGITQVVRGADLLPSTARQILLQRKLGLAHPDYLHIPLALDAGGRKLSKSEDSPPLQPENPLPALKGALQFLGYPPVPDAGTPGELLQWAITGWPSVQAGFMLRR